MTDGLDDFLAKHPGENLQVNGLRYHYLDEGDRHGEPVVMVHGNPSWSFYYRKLVETLTPLGYRAIVPDHIGCGYSEKPDDSRYEYTLERRVRDLEALVIGHLKLEKGITLAVHDWGGAIGFAFAARHPELISRLVVFNTAAFHLPKTMWFPWPLRFFRNWDLAPTLVRGLNLFCRGTAFFIGTRANPMSKAVRDAYLAPYDSWANRIAIHRFVQDIPLESGDRAYNLISFTENRLNRFADTPMLIAWGLRDPVFNRHFLNEWTRRFPKAAVHKFADSGHYILEDQSKAIIPLVVEFLAKHPVSRTAG